MKRCYICNTDHNVQKHHIKSRSVGGTDDPRNIVLLCNRHHDIYEGKPWIEMNMARKAFRNRRVTKKSSERGSLSPSEPFPLDTIPEGWSKGHDSKGWYIWKRTISDYIFVMYDLRYPYARKNEG